MNLVTADQCQTNVKFPNKDLHSLGRGFPLTFSNTLLTLNTAQHIVSLLLDNMTVKPLRKVVRL